MALLSRAELVVTMTFIFLVSSAPVLVLGGGSSSTRELLVDVDEGVGQVSEILVRGSGSGVATFKASPGRDHIDWGFFGRKMLAAAGRPVAARVPGNDGDGDEAPPEQQQLGAHATYSSSLTSTAPPRPPAPSTPYSSRFAFLFRSLAKGSSPPSTGTPSPGHN